jgi:lipopolysaccharide export system protein LptA
VTNARRSALIAVAAGLAVALSPARAQNFGLGTAQDNNKPINIEADQGIEWQQSNRVYIARGHAKATRGQATVFGDVLKAYYRPVSQPGAGTSAAAAEHKAGGSGDPIGGNSTEIYRLEAIGNVRIATETQTVYGDHAVYDVDRKLLVVTGKNLRLETPRDTLTARDSLEWYDDKQLAVARGDALETREGKRLRGDVLTATVTRTADDSASHISRIDAQGNVLVSSQDQIARGDAGVYNVDTGIATLTGRVTLTRADNELRGQYAVVDLNNNVSRLLSAPPATQLTEGKPVRVQGLIVPRQKPAAPAQ